MLVDQYGRPIQTAVATPGFGAGDVLGGAAFQELLGRGKEMAGRATEATGKALAGAGGVKGLARTGLGIAGKYAPLIGGGIQLMQGDPLGAVGSVGGGILGSALGPLGAIGGAAIGGAALKGIANLATGAAQAVTGGQMARGESPGIIPGVDGKEVGGLDSGKINELAKSLGMTQVEVAEKLMPTYNAMRNADVNRQMQLNQQLGQLTGALNQQKYMAQLAGGAQSEAGATTRSILTAANPYAESAFQYRG